MSRMIHFEIPSDDPGKAAEFYGNVFGWSFHKWDGPMDYWLITTGKDDEPGINGGLGRRTGPGGMVNTIGVASIDTSLEAIARAGGKITVPKKAVPGVGWLAYCVDLDGNTFGVMEADESAA